MALSGAAVCPPHQSSNSKEGPAAPRNTPDQGSGSPAGSTHHICLFSRRPRPMKNPGILTSAPDTSPSSDIHSPKCQALC